MTIRKGDTVQIISGRERGKKGTVILMDRERNRITLDGLNMRTHHLKPTQARPKGGIVQNPGSMARANVILVCPHCSRLTRGHMHIEAEQKYRSCTFCNGSFDTK